MPAKVRLDNGIEYDCAAEVAVELDRVRKERTDAVTERDTLKKERDSLTGERDELKARAEKAEKVDHSEAIRTGIKARLDVVEKASKVLDEEAQKKFDSMSDDEIRNAVIAAQYPELDLSKQSADYLRARFDAIVEGAKDGDGKAAQRGADKLMGDQKKRSDASDDGEKTRQDAIDAIKARSRGEEEKASK